MAIIIKSGGRHINVGSLQYTMYWGGDTGNPMLELYFSADHVIQLHGEEAARVYQIIESLAVSQRPEVG